MSNDKKKICQECGKDIKKGEPYVKEGSTYRHKKEQKAKKEKAVVCEFC